VAKVKKITAEQIHEAIKSYAYRVGTVAHSWNRLVETLGAVFVEVTKMDFCVARAIWYTFENDRSQIKMLWAAIEARPKAAWPPRFPQAHADLVWLAEKSFNLVDARNNIVHAPCMLDLSTDGASMVSDPFSGHDRAKRLQGKSLEDECEYCIGRSAALARFADGMLIALRNEPSAWPGTLCERRCRKVNPVRRRTDHRQNDAQWRAHCAVEPAKYGTSAPRSNKW
jgi:hypothetical protein